jgi:hypothetical protein
MSRTTACICDDIFLLEAAAAAAVAGPEAGVPDACACADGPDAEATEGWKGRIP